MPSTINRPQQGDARKPSSDQDEGWEHVSYKTTRFSSLADPDGISPLMLGKSKEVDEFDLDDSRHQHRPHRKRSSRRLSYIASPVFTAHRPSSDASVQMPFRSNSLEDDARPRMSSHRPAMSSVIDEVTSWLRAEKHKKKARKAKKKAKKVLEDAHAGEKGPKRFQDIPRRSSQSSSGSSLDLEKLEVILEKGMRSSIDLSSSLHLPGHSSSTNLRKLPSRSSRVFRRVSTLKPAETDGQDDEVMVPSCDVVLDNSKTLSYTGGDAKGEDNTDVATMKSGARAWAQFKHEILRLSHTLKLKGWRQVQMTQSNDIHVERLSGALTNAVYVVAPPEHLNQPAEQADGSKLPPAAPKKPPVKLLLRIYGAQTHQLIDREAELNILRRLAKKHIGPRMLATFANGRFEEFLHAQTLRPQDLRVPETSRQISKRMRELHDGIELLEEERDNGPFVWSNWDRCVERAEVRMRFLEPDRRRSDPICGTTWSTFRKTVEDYRRQLNREYGGPEKLNDQLVFAHNDAQYGNILRLEPPGESPLLLPANVHKQLVVIDFEYANANVPGLEFANHFTEWCYNYHDPITSYACNTSHYPTPEEQARFIRAYIAHQPEHAPAAPTTPRFTPLHHSSSFTSLSLEKGTSYFPQSADEARGRSSSTAQREQEMLRQLEKEKADAEAADREEVQRLMRETQLWRIANSAQWVVWGILQAHIPGLPDDDDKSEAQPRLTDGQASDPLDAEAEKAVEDLHDKRPDDAEEEQEEFDCLAYSRDRALFFWGDCLQMGLVTEEDLGEKLAKSVKIVPY